jgi:hypothetical protein
MPSLLEIAEAHQARRIRRTDRAVSRGLAAWSRMDVNALDASWQTVGPQVVGVTSAAQVANAQSSDPYVASTARKLGASRSENRVNPGAFVGVDGSGRDVESLLHGAVTSTKTAISGGFIGGQAMQVGAAYLTSMMKTAISDLGRSSDMTAATGQGWTQYVRVVQPGACSRCAILAGKSDYKTPFKRHPACKCTTMPVENDADMPPRGFYATPDDYFESLSPAEQDRVFTKGGAEAIRAGANPVNVVSARRGASGIQYGSRISTKANSGNRMIRTAIGQRQDGSTIYGYTTSEATTVRGTFGRTQTRIGVDSRRVAGSRYSAVKRTRLMPETIVSLTDDVALRQTLLRDAGYIDLSPTSAAYRTRYAVAAEDRVASDTFYRSLGIELG